MSDIPFAIKLCDQEKWGVTREDLERILRLDPRGSFIAYEGTRKVGLTTSTSYGKKLAWIGNVIVNRKERGKEIGRRLIEHSIAQLSGRGIRHVAIYCFKENARFYRRLGFVQDASFTRLGRKAKQTHFLLSTSEFEDTPPMKDLLKLDKRAFGADRSALIRSVTERGIGFWITLSLRSGFRGYLMVRKYEDLCELGPWISADKNRHQLTEMLQKALNEASELPIEISALTKNEMTLSLLRDQGFRVLRQGYRMFYEDKIRLGDDSCQYALGFLDKG